MSKDINVTDGTVLETLNNKVDLDGGNYPGSGLEEYINTHHVGMQLFDTILKDHVLTYEESKGLALQGTWVYKEAVAGSRYGYPDFYNKCLEEYNESVGERWVQPVLTANGVLGGNTFAVSADGEASNTPAYKMFDNDNSTYWYGTTNGKGYVILYNPTPLNIVNLKITNSQWVEDNIATGEILVSNNGTDWAKILTFTGNTASNATWEIDLHTNGGFYKYYKINILSLGSTSYPPAIVNLEIITGNLVKNTNGHLFYDIADKDIIDSIFESTGVAWMYGIDQENERIFLPRNNYFAIKGAIDNIPVVGNGMSLGFTKGDVNYGMSVYDTQGNIQMFRTTAYGVKLPYSVGANGTMPSNSVMGITTDPTKSGIIAETSDVLKIDDSKYLYICVGNTEAQSVITDVVDVTTTENDTLPLGYHFYQAGAQPSVSYLKSQGQWNDGNVYTTFYNEFVQKIGQDFASGKVVEVTDTYTDYDLVINQDDMTFRLPLLDGSEDLISTKYTSLTFNGDGSKYTAPANGWYLIQKQSSSGGQSIIIENQTTGMKNESAISTGGNQRLTIESFVNKGDIISIGTASSGSTNVFKFIYAQGNDSLYFKVANAVQNLELLDAGEVLEAVAEIASNTVLKTENKAYIVETYQNGASWYRIWSDGWKEQGGVTEAGTVTFLKAFSDTNYLVLVNNREENYNANSQYDGLCQPNTLKTTSFNTNGRLTMQWYACGY